MTTINIFHSSGRNFIPLGTDELKTIIVTQ